MLKNYIITAFRNIYKNKIISLFNILGLSLAFGCAIVIFIFIEFNFNVDNFHTHPDRTFLITYKKPTSNWDYGATPYLLGEHLASQQSDVEDMVRLNIMKGAVMATAQAPLYEFITFTDPGYFNLFNFPLSRGQVSALQDPSKAIISEAVAKKYFGQGNPLGETMDILLSNGQKISVTVGGVAEPFPLKRSFDFDFLINHQAIHLDASEQAWQDVVDATFIKTRTAQDGNKLAAAFDKFKTDYNQKNPDDAIASFGLTALSRVAQESYHIRTGFIKGYGPPSGKIAFTIIGIILITLACLNYVNTATALGISRLKEIGIRKVAGSRRSSIVWQFLTENFIINLFALLMGILIAVFLLVPGFDSLFQIGLTFEVDNLYLWAFLLVTLLITSLLSGAYPALYISKYKPVTILSGVSKIGTKSTFSRILLSFQFLLSFIYIVASLLFIANETYQRDKDWGYDKDNLYILQPADAGAFAFLKNELSSHPSVQHLAGTQHHIGSNYKETTIQIDTLQLAVHQFMVDTAYFETMVLKMKAGSSFGAGEGGDQQGVIVNETFAQNLGWTDAVGKHLTIDEQDYYVRGVVQDFRYTGFQKKIEPVVFTLSKDRAFNFLVLRLGKQDAEAIRTCENLWKKASPQIPFNGYFQDQLTERYFVLMAGHSKVMVFSAILAVTLACLGLFGLVYLNIIARLKDYSIMKVLGINTVGLSREVIKIFIWFLGVAIVIGFPASMFLSRMLFKIVYSDYIAITFWYPLAGATLLIFISFATVSALIYRLLKENPAEVLRN